MNHVDDRTGSDRARDKGWRVIVAILLIATVTLISNAALGKQASVRKSEWQRPSHFVKNWNYPYTGNKEITRQVSEVEIVTELPPAHVINQDLSSVIRVLTDRKPIPPVQVQNMTVADGSVVLREGDNGEISGSTFLSRWNVTAKAATLRGLTKDKTYKFQSQYGKVSQILSWKIKVWPGPYHLDSISCPGEVLHNDRERMSFTINLKSSALSRGGQAMAFLLTPADAFDVTGYTPYVYGGHTFYEVAVPQGKNRVKASVLMRPDYEGPANLAVYVKTDLVEAVRTGQPPSQNSYLYEQCNFSVSRPTKLGDPSAPTGSKKPNNKKRR